MPLPRDAYALGSIEIEAEVGQIQQTTNWWYFSYFFSIKIGIDLICLLFPEETIFMNCQSFFWGKNKKIISKCHLLNFPSSKLNVNDTEKFPWWSGINYVLHFPAKSQSSHFIFFGVRFITYLYLSTFFPLEKTLSSLPTMTFMFPSTCKRI